MLPAMVLFPVVNRRDRTRFPSAVCSNSLLMVLVGIKALNPFVTCASVPLFRKTPLPVTVAGRPKLKNE